MEKSTLTLKRTRQGVPWRLVFNALHRGHERTALQVPGATGNGPTFPAEPRVVEQLRAAFAVDELEIDGEVKEWYSAMMARVRDAAELALESRVPLPNVPYAARLHDYQTVGAQWLTVVKKGILADEPGLGKTIQALAGCDILREPAKEAGKYKKQRVLIVTLGGQVSLQWMRHIREWCKSQATIASSGTKTQRIKALERDVRFTIVSHAMLRPSTEKRASPYAAYLLEREWDVVIVDEAHRLQGRHSQQSTGARYLKTENLWMLTGTPIWNLPPSLWHMLHLIDRKRFSSFWGFVYDWCKVDQMPWGRKIRGPIKDKVPELRRMIAPMVLRRETDILPPGVLPPVRFETVEYDISPAQRKLYNEMKNGLRMQWESLDKSYMSMGAAMGDLRLLVSAPQLLGIEEESPKDEVLTRIVEDHIENGHQVIVFCWHKKYVDYLTRMLAGKFGPSAVRGIAGHTPMAQRTRWLDEFKKGQRQILVSTIGTTGTGTDLYMARAVVFAECDWTPANNEQAWKRIHRLGQKHSSVVYYLMARRTVEANVYRTFQQKAAIADELLNVPDELLLQVARETIFEGDS